MHFFKNSLIIICRNTSVSSELIMVGDVGRQLRVNYKESMSTEQQPSDMIDVDRNSSQKLSHLRCINQSDTNYCLESKTLARSV